MDIMRLNEPNTGGGTSSDANAAVASENIPAMACIPRMPNQAPVNDLDISS
jgi:hypothetical protein